jgi:MFS family permease
MREKIRNRLQNASDLQFSLFAGLAAFSTYFCMYAFRKPFGAVPYDNEADVWGINFKIIITISQLVGYCLSKFIGVKIVSESTYETRGRLILLSVFSAFAALLLFAISPDYLKPVFMFINGLLLGMNWGLVCGFIEGRRTSDILGAIVSASFILASGYVKQIGHWLVLEYKVPEVWMPFAVGLIFVPIIYFSVYCLNCLPQPDEKDKALKQERLPFAKEKRWKFFRDYAPGLIMLMIIYIFLTVFRSIRDDFAAEFWRDAGMGNDPSLFSASETPIALIITASLIVLYFIKSNMISYRVLNVMMVLGTVTMGLSTLAYQQNVLSPLQFMIISGTGAYMAYVPFGCVLFDNLTALLGLHYTCGFMIVFADAVGYTGVVICYLYKEFFEPNLNWHDFLVQFSLITAVVSFVCFIISYMYFRTKMNTALKD